MNYLQLTLSVFLVGCSVLLLGSAVVDFNKMDGMSLVMFAVFCIASVALLIESINELKSERHEIN